MDRLISLQAAIDAPVKMVSEGIEWIPVYHIKDLPSAQPEKAQLSGENATFDCISRQTVIDAIDDIESEVADGDGFQYAKWREYFCDLPSAQSERKWTPCSNPPKHHRDVLVRGIEAIGNVNVYKVMQWDVDTWRPTDYAPSIIWKEWSEI